MTACADLPVEIERLSQPVIESRRVPECSRHSSAHLECGECGPRRPAIPSRLSAPSWTSMRTHSPTKSGFSSLAASTFAATAEGRSAAPITFAASRIAAPASRPASVTTWATRPPIRCALSARRSRAARASPTSRRAALSNRRRRRRRHCPVLAAARPRSPDRR